MTIRLLLFISLVVVTALVSFLVNLAYLYEWSGFGPYLSPPVPAGREFERAKTLWDWLELLIIPFVLAVGAIIYNWWIAKTEREIAGEERLELSLHTYLDKLATLLLQGGLHGAEPDAPVGNVARALTVTVLRTLDGKRKGVVLQFLMEAGLIQNRTPIVDLSGGAGTGIGNADRGADLSRVLFRQGSLRNVYLPFVDMSYADFEGSHIGDATMYGSRLVGANLRLTDIVSTNLSGADLREASLEGANLTSNNLDGPAQLNGADLRGANLRNAKLGGIYSRGRHVPGADLSDTDLRRVDLRGADLSGSVQTVYLKEHHQKENGAILRRANLQSAKLEGADLRGADLCSADLRSTNLKSTLLTGATYDDETKWPTGVCVPTDAINRSPIKQNDQQSFPICTR